MSAEFGAAAARLAGFAAVVLGWGPDTFWRATPDELACVAGVLAGDAPAAAVGHVDLAALMEAFPDG